MLQQVISSTKSNNEIASTSFALVICGFTNFPTQSTSSTVNYWTAISWDPLIAKLGCCFSFVRNLFCGNFPCEKQRDSQLHPRHWYKNGAAEECIWSVKGDWPGERGVWLCPETQYRRSSKVYGAFLCRDQAIMGSEKMKLLERGIWDFKQLSVELFFVQRTARWFFPSVALRAVIITFSASIFFLLSSALHQFPLQVTRREINSVSAKRLGQAFDKEPLP